MSDFIFVFKQSSICRFFIIKDTTYEFTKVISRVQYELQVDIARHRGSADGVRLSLEICLINDESYLKNVAAYIIVQPTKDGKAILPYDYLYGTGALYFRQKGTILPWEHDFNGHLYEKTRLGTLSIRAQWKICNTKTPMPEDWTVVNGFIHPLCYTDVNYLESIYKTHNCFRAFTASSLAQELRRTYRLSLRQLSTLVKLPEDELREYVR